MSKHDLNFGTKQLIKDSLTCTSKISIFQKKKIYYKYKFFSLVQNILFYFFFTSISYFKFIHSQLKNKNFILNFYKFYNNKFRLKFYRY